MALEYILSHSYCNLTVYLLSFLKKNSPKHHAFIFIKMSSMTLNLFPVSLELIQNSPKWMSNLNCSFQHALLCICLLWVSSATVLPNYGVWILFLTSICIDLGNQNSFVSSANFSTSLFSPFSRVLNILEDTTLVLIADTPLLTVFYAESWSFILSFPLYLNSLLTHDWQPFTSCPVVGKFP